MKNPVIHKNVNYYKHSAVKKSKRELISNKYTLRAKYMLETGNYLKSEEDVDKNYLSNYVKWLEEKTLKEN